MRQSVDIVSTICQQFAYHDLWNDQTAYQKSIIAPRDRFSSFLVGGNRRTIPSFRSRSKQIYFFSVERDRIENNASRVHERSMFDGG